MSRYVDADEFERAVMFSDDEDIQDVIYRLRDFPAADVVEVVHGEWITCQDDVAIGVDGYKCEKCGYFVPWDYTHKSPYFIDEYHYCPNCGARMYERRKDEPDNEV